MIKTLIGLLLLIWLMVVLGYTMLYLAEDHKGLHQTHNTITRDKNESSSL